MLVIQAELLTGRFVATDYADRLEAEWPPHPARLFSALVAAWADEARDDERAALRWLEAQPPPEILASAASRRDVVTVFVPVNDATDGLLPDERVRQPRTFPSVTPEIPRFALVWPEAELTDALRATLDRLCARVHRLGHSSSLVSLRVMDTPMLHEDASRLVPREDGEATLRVVQPGQLEALEAAHALHQETQPRVMPAAFQRYGAPEAAGREPVAASCFDPEWIVLRRIRGAELPITAGFPLARAVRGALMASGVQPPPELISGHLADGAPSARDHLAIVPLPFVGREHADGALKGVALVLPRGLSEQDRNAVFRAITGWEDRARATDPEQHEHPPLPVYFGRGARLSLELTEENLPHTLRPETWCAPSRVWASVTPIALNRNPGELRRRSGQDPQAESERIRGVEARAAQIVADSVIRLGLPAPEGVELRPQPLVQGSRPCRDFPGFLSGGHPRVLVHAVLRFAQPVSGPLLLGAGRYYGYGLMRPLPEEGA